MKKTEREEIIMEKLTVGQMKHQLKWHGWQYTRRNGYMTWIYDAFGKSVASDASEAKAIRKAYALLQEWLMQKHMENLARLADVCELA